MVTDRVGPTVNTLKAEVDFLGAEVKAAKAEIASLLNTLADTRTENMRLRKEMERMAAQVIEAEKYNGWHQQACLENERLRAALGEAIEFADQDYHVLTPTGEAMIARWRAALNGEEGRT